MMKKTLIIGGVLLSSLLFSQCLIQGAETINIEDESTYFVPNEIAQCKDCHQWSFTGTDAKVVGDIRQNVIKIKPSTVGKLIISISVLTPKGIQQCTKSVEVISPFATGSGLANIGIDNGSPQLNDTTAKDEPECNIIVNNFKEVKYSEGLINFIPDKIDATYRYTWKATYSDGSVQESKEIAPQLNYTLQHNIAKLELKVISSNCIKNISKEFSQEFWQYLR